MKQDEMIELAKQAGGQVTAWVNQSTIQKTTTFTFESPIDYYVSGEYPEKYHIKFLEAFAKLAIAKAIKELESQEPVAWIHNFIEGGISIGKRPVDLERHPDRWTALYKNPKPCPTCEALARMVMLDQTSHDTTPPQRTWVGLDEKDFSAINQSCLTKLQAATSAESILKEKNT
jgi:hypothetical protein